jgi:hypothetical protein
MQREAQQIAQQWQKLPRYEKSDGTRQIYQISLGSMLQEFSSIIIRQYFC